MGAADGNRVVGPQAQFLAVSVGGQKEPAANLLAGHVEKDRRRVQDRRLGPLEAGAEEMIERALAGASRRVASRRSARVSVTGSSLISRPSLNKAAQAAQPFSGWKVNALVGVPVAAAARSWSDAIGSARRITLDATLSAMKPPFALGLLHWVFLALVLSAFGQASAQETHPLDLDQTRSALSAIETALRTKASPTPICSVFTPKTTSSAFPCKGRSPISTPRLAASAKRLAELKPKSGEAAPATDVAAKELASETQRHDRLDADLRSARAMLLQSDDLGTRIGAARREHFRPAHLRAVVERPRSSALAGRLARRRGRRAVMASLAGDWLRRAESA